MTYWKPPRRLAGETERKFVPDYHNRYIASKFYAKHDKMLVERTPRVMFYEEVYQTYLDYDARDHYCFPRYTNQVYGWQKKSPVRVLQDCDRTELFQKSFKNTIHKVMLEKIKQEREAERKKLKKGEEAGEEDK